MLTRHKILIAREVPPRMTNMIDQSFPLARIPLELYFVRYRLNDVGAARLRIVSNFASLHSWPIAYQSPRSGSVERTLSAHPPNQKRSFKATARSSSRPNWTQPSALHSLPSLRSPGWTSRKRPRQMSQPTMADTAFDSSRIPARSLLRTSQKSSKCSKQRRKSTSTLPLQSQRISASQFHSDLDHSTSARTYRPRRGDSTKSPR